MDDLLANARRGESFVEKMALLDRVCEPSLLARACPPPAAAALPLELRLEMGLLPDDVLFLKLSDMT